MSWVLATVVTPLAAGLVWADMLVLDTGAVLEGEIEQLEDGSVKISFPTGWDAEFPAETIHSITLEPGNQGAVEEAPQQVVRVTPRPRVVHQVQRTRPAPASPEALQTARAIQASYAKGWRGQGERLVEQHPQAYRWDELEGVANVQCAYDGRRMEVTIEREPGQDDDLVVAFPPGTYGTERNGSRYQDLVFLRAPVTVLPAGAQKTTVEIPVACGRYGWATPEKEMGFALTRFAPDSDMDRLLLHLCSGERAKPDAESQLAVWAVGNELSRTQFEERHTTFESSSRILRSHGAGAANLIARAGVDPEAYPFFQGMPEAPSETPAATLPGVEESETPAVFRHRCRTRQG